MNLIFSLLLFFAQETAQERADAYCKQLQMDPGVCKMIFLAGDSSKRTAVFPGIGAGQGATATIEGDDRSGRITIKTGTGCLPGPMRIAVVFFAFPYETPPKVRPYPVNAAAASINAWFVSEGMSGRWFQLGSNQAPLQDNTEYVWDYEVRP